MSRSDKEIDNLMINWLIDELAQHWAIKHKISVAAAYRAIVFIMLKEADKK